MWRNRPVAAGVQGAMRRSFAMLAVAVMLAACATPGGTTTPSTPPSSGPSGSPNASPPPSDDGSGGIPHPDGDEAVLVVSSAGGFVPVDFIVRAMPTFVMLGDGRVFQQGAVPAIFPGPPFAPMSVRQLTPDGVQQVLRAVEQTGLFTQDLDLRGAAGMVADAPDTVFTLNAAGRQVTITVYALGMLAPDMEPPPGMSSAEVEAHRLLSALLEGLMTIDTAVTSDGWTDDGWRAWEPDAFRLYVRDASGEPPDEGLPEDVRDWPTDADPATFGDEVALFGDGTRCGAVDGEDGIAWRTALAQASEITRWTTDGTDRWSVGVRPLLPYEAVACPEPMG